MSQATQHSEASRIAQFMGLRGWSEIDDLRLVERVESGLPFSTADRIVRKLDPSGTYFHVTDIVPKSTYYRRKKQGKPLSKVESETVFALSKVFSEAVRQYHGDAGRAASFLSRDHPLLKGRSPLEVARESAAGAELILKLLAQAEAGVAI